MTAPKLPMALPIWVTKAAPVAPRRSWLARLVAWVKAR